MNLTWFKPINKDHLINTNDISKAHDHLTDWRRASWASFWRRAASTSCCYNPRCSRCWGRDAPSGSAVSGRAPPQPRTYKRQTDYQYKQVYGMYLLHSPRLLCVWSLGSHWCDYMYFNSTSSSIKYRKSTPCIAGPCYDSCEALPREDGYVCAGNLQASCDQLIIITSKYMVCMSCSHRGADAQLQFDDVFVRLTLDLKYWFHLYPFCPRQHGSIQRGATETNIS